MQCQLRKPEGYGQNRGLQNKAKHIKSELSNHNNLGFAKNLNTCILIEKFK